MFLDGRTEGIFISKQKRDSSCFFLSAIILHLTVRTYSTSSYRYASLSAFPLCTCCETFRFKMSTRTVRYEYCTECIRMLYVYVRNVSCARCVYRHIIVSHHHTHTCKRLEVYSNTATELDKVTIFKLLASEMTTSRSAPQIIPCN